MVNETGTGAASPELPSDDELRDEIVRTATPEHWNPHGDGPRATALDYKALPPDVAAAAIEARLQIGPGRHANPFQLAVFEQHRRDRELSAEAARLTEDLTANRGFDRDTGEPIPLFSPERRKAIVDRLAAIGSEKARIKGKPGELALEKALEQAIKFERDRRIQEHIQREAERRAEAQEVEEAIALRAAMLRKVRPGLGG